MQETAQGPPPLLPQKNYYYFFCCQFVSLLVRNNLYNNFASFWYYSNGLNCLFIENEVPLIYSVATSVKSGPTRQINGCISKVIHR